MRVAAAILLLMTAMPAAAQLALPEAYDGAQRPRGNPMFAGMSDAGRAAMRTALNEADPRGGRAMTDAARDRMLAVLDADRLDVGALRRAMDDEREAANAAKVRHQAGMIAGLQQLSLADRRAFVANARAVRARMESGLAATRRGAGQGTLPQ